VIRHEFANLHRRHLRFAAKEKEWPEYFIIILFTISLFHFLSFTHTNSLSLSLSFTHTHTHTHMHRRLFVPISASLRQTFFFFEPFARRILSLSFSSVVVNTVKELFGTHFQR